MQINDLPTPALLLDAGVLHRNLSRMQDRANRLGVALRPHIKTHKSPAIAGLQHSLGSQGFTVSTWYEVERFSEAGFADLTWALPFPAVYASRAAALARSITLRLLVDSASAVDALEAEARRSDVRFHVWLKVDCGYHRAGVDPHDQASVFLAKRIADSPRFVLDGILTHAGHSYNASSSEEIRTIARQERDGMTQFAETLRSNHVDVGSISVGSTPTMTFIDDLAGITEMRPGNYCFHDLTMVSLGVCTVADCALTVLGSVISTRPGQVLTDAGALALSKDVGAAHCSPKVGFGLLVRDYASSTLYDPSIAHVSSISQEHGKIAVDDSVSLRIGNRVRILMQHSCLSAALFDHYNVVDGDNVVDRWKILRGRI
ncbi:MAG: alanine racemase [Bacteroidetes bacterium]|jgi:D-serine deaminase-like pyridoxal phosphate-dependent protein|nr:alanine racemase [Bacteroidota bacterium]